MSAGATLPRISLDDLVALNDEIAALARAGVPLDLGLRSLSGDMPGRLGKVAAAIAQRLEAGESLPQILAEPGKQGIPAAYAAVVSAGIRAGRLPVALEGIAHALRRHRQLRRALALALVYPLLIVLVTFGLLAFWLNKIAPELLTTYSQWGTPEGWVAPTAAWLSETAPIWSKAIPLLVAAYGIWLWYRSGESLASGRDRWYHLGIVGRLRRMRGVGQRALLADVLGVLLEHGTPLDEALLVAGGAVGQPALRRGAEELAEKIRSGQSPGVKVAGFPPLIGCLLASTSGIAAGQSLRRVARTYHDDAANRARRLATQIPLLFTLVLAGGSVALYAAITIVPWFLLLKRISQLAGT